jgi:hypothetical protein
LCTGARGFEDAWRIAALQVRVAFCPETRSGNIDRGRSDLLQTFITDEDDPHGDGDTGLPLALAHLVGPAGLASCIAQLEAVTKQLV